MKNNNDNKREKPIVQETMSMDITAHGRLMYTVTTELYTNKDYFKVEISFPNGDKIQDFFSNRRFTEVKMPKSS